MSHAWAARERRETRRLAAMLGATLEADDTAETDPEEQAAEHQRLAAFCRINRIS